MNQSTIASSLHPVMVIEAATDLGEDALLHPQKYKGFMGISVGHKYFSKSTMESFFLWGSQVFKEFIILLLDDPDQYNFMVFEELDSQKALQKARTIGDERTRAMKKVLNKIGIQNITITCSREFNQTNKFQHILHQTEKYMTSDITFKKELYSLMQSSIGGKIAQFLKTKALSPSESEIRQGILSKYIMEEFASLLYFTENGYPIEVDPTKEFTTKKLLYEGQFNELKNLLSLSRRGHIYTHPEGAIKSSY